MLQHDVRSVPVVEDGVLVGDHLMIFVLIAGTARAHSS
jgi:hypothetical protein